MRCEYPQRVVAMRYGPYGFRYVHLFAPSDINQSRAYYSNTPTHQHSEGKSTWVWCFIKMNVLTTCRWQEKKVDSQGFDRNNLSRCVQDSCCCNQVSCGDVWQEPSWGVVLYEIVGVIECVLIKHYVWSKSLTRNYTQAVWRTTCLRLFGGILLYQFGDIILIIFISSAHLHEHKRRVNGKAVW